MILRSIPRRVFFPALIASSTWCSAITHAEELTIHHPGIAEVTLFADNPDIVTPTGIAVAPDGRVFVQENHTHHRPEDYEGPETDRIYTFEDTDGDGVHDKRSIFYEGLITSTDLLFAPDGNLYATTRWDVFRFPDAANLEVAAGDPELIVHCDTECDYPHDGVGGLAINPHDPTWLYFGFGENLGEDYTFIGSDDIRLSGGGEGGSTYRCRLDGSKLEKLSTGHWNPFGMGFDLAGNLFATDNDPGGRPPNRLLHVVKGADFGFEFRYGRSGRHPLQTWTGEFPGTLGMVTPIGEGACGVIPFGPGELLVASWADNRVYRHELEPDGRSFSASRNLFLGGSNQFRPVHFSYNADGTELYITDWVLRNYPVHGEGRVWKVKFNKPVDFTLTKPDDPSPMNPEEAVSSLGNPDPYVRTEAVRFVAQNLDQDWRTIENPVARSHYAVAMKRSGKESARAQLPHLLNDPDEAVCFVAVKWIADEKLTEFKVQLREQIDRDELSQTLLFAILAAEQTLNGEKPSDTPSTNQLRSLFNDQTRDSTLRALALSLMPPDSLPINRLTQMALENPPAIRLEAIRNLQAATSPERIPVLAELASDREQPSPLRAEAVLGLASVADTQVELLNQLSSDADPAVATEAQRALAGAGLHTRELKEKPATFDAAEWTALLKALPGEPDLEAGRRIYFHPRLATCATCHEMDGRGRRVGPDLSTIHQQSGVNEEWLLTHILNPAETVAPQYLPWQVLKTDGTSTMGFVLRKGGTRETYLGIDGKEFSVQKPDIVSSTELDISLMPPGLLMPLQPEEIRDLLAYLLAE
ncbi:MAG: PVC-type heme-binding CxxCH protein [Verrucomicrobiota bacterium]